MTRSRVLFRKLHSNTLEALPLGFGHLGIFQECCAKLSGAIFVFIMNLGFVFVGLCALIFNFLKPCAVFIEKLIISRFALLQFFPNQTLSYSHAMFLSCVNHSEGFAAVPAPCSRQGFAKQI
jgi:hypothetical protein